MNSTILISALMTIALVGVIGSELSETQVDELLSRLVFFGDPVTTPASIDDKKSKAICDAVVNIHKILPFLYKKYKGNPNMPKLIENVASTGLADIFQSLFCKSDQAYMNSMFKILSQKTKDLKPIREKFVTAILTVKTLPNFVCFLDKWVDESTTTMGEFKNKIMPVFKLYFTKVLSFLDSKLKPKVDNCKWPSIDNSLSTKYKSLFLPIFESVNSATK